jgi:hypothetical protein
MQVKPVVLSGLCDVNEQENLQPREERNQSGGIL